MKFGVVQQSILNPVLSNSCMAELQSNGQQRDISIQMTQLCAFLPSPRILNFKALPSEMISKLDDWSDRNNLASKVIWSENYYWCPLIATLNVAESFLRSFWYLLSFSSYPLFCRIGWCRHFVCIKWRKYTRFTLYQMINRIKKLVSISMPFWTSYRFKRQLVLNLCSKASNFLAFATFLR